MAGLTAPPDNTPPEAGQIVEADGWFPGLSTSLVRANVRIGEGAVTEARLVEALTAGILSGLRALSTWRSAHATAGIGDLAGVTSDTVAGRNLGVLLWERIVTYYAAAEIVDGHTDVSATDDTLDREEEKRTTADLYRRKAYEAVADLRAIANAAAPDAAIDAGRNRVELI